MLFSSVREWECEELLLSGREERKRERKVHRGGAGKKKKNARGKKRSPGAEREGVTTAALSITIFTTRRNLRET